MSGLSSGQTPRSRMLLVIFIYATMLISCASIAILQGTDTLSGPVNASGESEWRLRQLTTNGGTTASISGDGTKVAFISNPNSFFTTTPHVLAVINSNGTGFRELVSTICYYPSIDRNGSRIAFNCDFSGISQIAVIDSDGSGFKKLTSVGRNIFPCISGDGSKVVFMGDSVVWVVSSDGTGLKQLTYNLTISYDGYSSSPSISGNGSKVVFHANDNVSGGSAVFIINSDGTGLRRLAEGSFPQINYEGTKIVFIGYYGIYIIDSDGTGLKLIVGAGHDVCISGSGNRIAFTDFVADNSEIFSVFTNGSDLKKLVDTRNNYYPSISGDGTEVVFESMLNGRYQVMISYAPQKAPPSRTWVVDAGGSGDSNKIQDSVSAASPGDVIEVLNDIYSETVVVTTHQLTIRGESNALTIVQGGFQLLCDYTTLSNFRIEGVGTGDMIYNSTGIEFRSASFNLVMDNDISGCGAALVFDYVQAPLVVPESCENNTIAGNNIVGNHNAIFFNEGETNNRFYHNYFSGNQRDVDYARGFKEIWDNGYPSGGNYWDNCTGVDLMHGPAQNQSGSDGIIDNVHVVTIVPYGEAQIDHYPLVGPWSRTIRVPDEYPTIQAAVNQANVGNTILVGEGIYSENIHVIKDCLVIRSEKGTTATIIQAASSSTDAIVVTANFVNITGFTVENAASIDVSGICLVGAFGCNIVCNNVTDNYYGIGLNSSNGNTILNNTAARNVDGIHLVKSSDNNLILDNKVMGNSGKGIHLSDSAGNIISNNVAENSFYLESSSGNTIHNNLVFRTETGIELAYTSQNNSVIGNTVSTNHFGLIAQALSHRNVFVDNVVKQNDIGFRLDSSGSNSIYHNSFIGNTQQVVILNSTNLWDNGYPSGGNNWSDYIGVDANHDGIGDFPYIIDSTNLDHYPFMRARAARCCFTISLGSPVTLFITDPLGRSFGVSPESGQTLGQIPNATYLGNDSRCIMIISPLNGSYSIQLRAATAGFYTLTVELSTTSGISTKNYTSQISTGENQAHVADVSGNLLMLHLADAFPWSFLYASLILVVLATGLILFLRWTLRSSQRSFDKISGDDDETVVY